MRMDRFTGVVCPLLLAVAMSLTACQRAPEGGGGGSGGALAGTVTPSGYGATFLGIDECSSHGSLRGRDFREVPCVSEKAAARVLARHEGRPADGPACPARTDFVLHISESRPAFDEDGDGAVARGFACMRNLEEPHPGDPGRGGGPRTVVGDCVYTASKGQVKETPCDGSGETAPQFRVAAAVQRRAQCPPPTQLYVQLGGDKAVGCARRV
ncbi:hypothetical protein J7I98_12695 [Streptomyces sp. ISL-98]|uniref:hypothetical protein n=1 Tax=Streptomyces sp. ISL-98 TaxID=2819192 RepID=UPI001BEC8B35|nr:hypothetical protein [Streptomyces sp. ISL-98]MBT2506732.1 hypothetical protein [Streptomyces sp. ISL-98]